MKGYHYTSKTNWDRIQKDGEMKPYFFDPNHDGKAELYKYFPKGVNGIWLWKQNPEGKSHAGNILYQVSTKGEEEIVKLEVEYHPGAVINYKGAAVEFVHSGDVGAWRYHEGDKSVIVAGAIPANRIRLMGQYNTVQRLQ